MDMLKSIMGDTLKRSINRVERIIERIGGSFQRRNTNLDRKKYSKGQRPEP